VSCSRHWARARRGMHGEHRCGAASIGGLLLGTSTCMCDAMKHLLPHQLPVTGVLLIGISACI
jgi:hypothetical protein